jgi:glucose-6-phosphate 1-dehydrogenase
MSFAQAFHVRAPEAYERLIMDVVRGDQTLFMRRDEVAAAWRYIDPILNHWKASYSKPEPYASGTWGPEAAMDLIEKDRRHWHQIEKE